MGDVTLAAYLPEGSGFRPEESLRVYSPCGRNKSCRIINNQIYCRRWGMPNWAALFLLFVTYTLGTILCTPLWNAVRKKVKTRRVDREIVELARLREQAWELSEHEEVADHENDSKE